MLQNEASEELQDEDFTDMPRLVPAGQEDDCQPGPRYLHPILYSIINLLL